MVSKQRHRDRSRRDFANLSPHATKTHGHRNRQLLGTSDTVHVHTSPHHNLRSTSRCIHSHHHRSCRTTFATQVVPYNPFLSRTFQAHINVEFCASPLSVRYLYKVRAWQRHTHSRNETIDPVMYPSSQSRATCCNSVNLRTLSSSLLLAHPPSRARSSMC